MARKVSYDSEKVKELRSALIEDSLMVFNDDPAVARWSEYRKQLLAKYAPYVLPRLNAGRTDDERYTPQPLLGGLTNDKGHHSDTEAPQAQEED